MITIKSKKNRRNRCKPRTSDTLNNKLRSLKSRYTRLFNNSKNSSTSNAPHFFETYPTFESFKAKIKFREVGRSEESKKVDISKMKRNIKGYR